MNDMSVLFDVMRGWLALLSLGATMLWLFYRQEPDGEGRRRIRVLHLSNEPDGEPDGKRLPGAADARAGVVARRSISDQPAPVPPLSEVWYPEQLDLSTGELTYAGARVANGVQRTSH